MTLNRFDNFNQRSDKDKLMKKRKMMEEQKYYRDRRDTGIYSSRSFAIGLVGVASCYLLVMICKAYRRLSIEQETANYGISESLTYYYDTESYDWNQYESADDQNATNGVKRDFEYNVSIGT